MTVASEITRLNTAKACLKASIEGKGVTVGSGLSLSDYYACVDAISTGPATGYLDILVVGGGGNGYGFNVGGYACSGGGAGGFIECMGYPITCESYEVCVGVGGQGGIIPGCNISRSCSDSQFGCAIAYGGGNALGRGGSQSGGHCCGGDGGSGGGGMGGGGASGCSCTVGGYGVPGQGNKGGDFVSNKAGGGGAGGAGGDGNNPVGGPGKCSCISGSCQRYAAGGSGGSNIAGGTGGGGSSCSGSCCATTYGSGGGGGPTSKIRDGKGCQGVVIVRYKTDGSCGICNTSIGGCKYTCGQYTIHCFTDTGVMCEFRPVYK